MLPVRPSFCLPGYGGYLWSQMMDFCKKKKLLRSGFVEKAFFFWLPDLTSPFVLSNISFFRIYYNLHRISSTDIKFHLKMCVHSGVTTFLIFPAMKKNFFQNWKRYNSWMNTHFQMKFEICRWNSMQITVKF